MKKIIGIIKIILLSIVLTLCACRLLLCFTEILPNIDTYVLYVNRNNIECIPLNFDITPKKIEFNSFTRYCKIYYFNNSTDSIYDTDSQLSNYIKENGILKNKITLLKMMICLVFSIPIIRYFIRS